MPGIEETVQLEGFGESIRGRRVYVVASSPMKVQGFLKAKMDTLDAELAYRGRKVLVVQHTAPPPRWAVKIGWDAIFHVRDIQDLKLAITYVQHMIKPGRLVWLGTPPAPQVVTAMNRVENLTWIAVGESTPQDTWDAIFWSPDIGQEEVELACGSRMGSSASLKSILKELRASDVGLVWSSIGETDKRGALYWYDPAEEGSGKIALDPEEAAELLRSLADSLLNKR